MSHETHKSDSTLADIKNGIGGGGGVHLDPFLSAAGVLAGFDQGGGLWEAPTGGASFESDPAFLAGYGVVGPSSAEGHIWEGGDAEGESWDVEDAAKVDNWDIGEVGLLGFGNK